MNLPTQSIVLDDRRRVGWVEVGDPHGRPVLYQHGTPGSALEATPLAELARAAGTRLIAVDRPGVGGSDLAPGRTVLDWVDDLVEVADRLELDRPAVVGYSGGGPYALASAAAAPDRFGPIGVVSGAGPVDGPAAWAAMDRTDRTLTWLSERAPRVGTALIAGSGRFTRVLPGVALRLWLTDLSPADRRVLLRGDTPAREVMRFLAGAMIDGARGVLEDERVLAQPWGFAADDITAPVRWWHGVDDATVPLASVQPLLDALPDLRLQLIDDAGHLLWPDHGPAILRGLAGEPSGEAAKPQH